MFHVFALIVTLAGMPAAVWESNDTFGTKLECEAKAPEIVATLQSKIANIDGGYTIAGVACATEDDLKGTKGGQDAERVD